MRAPYVFFLAHAGPDTASAKELWSLLQADVPVFLDACCLLPGDEWDVELVRRQKEALATVALLSSSTDAAYYLREEIANAIAFQRNEPDRHRLVPVYLDGIPKDPSRIPYGLRVRHALDVAELGMKGVAAELRKVAARLSDAVPATLSEDVPTPTDRIALFDALCALMLSQFDEVLLRVGAPGQHMVPTGEPILIRALGLVQWAEQGGPVRMASLSQAIVRTAPRILQDVDSGHRQWRLVHEALTGLMPTELDEVIVTAQVPRRHLSADTAPMAKRAKELCEWAGNSEANGEALRAALERVRKRGGGAPIGDGVAAGGSALPADPAARGEIVIPASRSTVVIAVEEAQDPLDERQLLRAERHMTVTLAPAQVAALADICASVDRAAALDDLCRCGAEAWRILETAQPGLRDLMETLRGAFADGGHPQPVAWTGKAALLLHLSKAVSIARMDAAGGVGSLVSVCGGSHYFHPLAEPGQPRSMRKRQLRPGGAAVRVRTIRVAEDAGAEDAVRRELTGAPDSEVVLLSAAKIDAPLLAVAEFVRRHAHAATRLAIGLGASQPTPDRLQTLMAVLPGVSFGGPALRRDEVLREIEQRLPTALTRQAAPVVLASVRAGLLQRAYEQHDVDLFRDAAFWATWSWVGRPLFSSRFGEVLGAAYPHLMHLRGVASPEWYFDRGGKDIPPEYKAENLLERDPNPARRFHLYLSGAGGTGKSCFLRHVHDKLEINQPQVLPVWYKVDAPSSNWDNVERRVKEEVRRALERRLGDGAAQGLLDDRMDLGFFLKDLVRKLAGHPSGLDEVVIFIDQLERTFESGDNPELYRLENISKNFMNLLDTVGAGQGVRIFIASRKQYLPDFLSSFQNAFRYSLHFNVLQKISEDGEQIGFVQKVLDWCRRNKLIDPSVQIDEPARKELAAGVDGHPLKMMLALIQIFSQNPKGEIGRSDIRRLAPWEQLFYVDEQLASKDDIDWYFFLAMAHARTEIVRFEEVWWRLRLVTPDLTQTVENLGRQGVLERLWLLGHLGRTVHPRPLGDDPAAFVEFFHANLRDHLVATVMNYGGEDLRGAGRRGGTPAAWRALDRLLVVAKDWKQSQQLMLREDVEALMRQKEEFVRKEGGVEAFYLLFLRDNEEHRAALFQAAKECFAYSAVVHDVLGRWVFKQLFPKVADQVECCERWLQRCDRESRIKLMQYLVELRDPPADRALARLVFDDPRPEQVDEAAQQLASVLAEPLVASRYRGAFVVSLVRFVLEQGIEFPADDRHTQRFGEFCAAACNADRDELLRLLGELAEGVMALPNPRLQGAVAALLDDAPAVDRWLQTVAGRGADPALNSRQIHDFTPPRIELRVGERLRDEVSRERLGRWQAQTVERLGVPLPAFTLSEREVAAYAADRPVPDDRGRGFELELLIDGRMIALGQFHPALMRTLKRHWDLAQRPFPDGGIEAYDEAVDECVVWLDGAQLAGIDGQDTASDFERAVLDWIAALLRRHVDQVFTYYDVPPFIGALAAAGDSRLNLAELLRTVSDNLYPLWQVLVNLCREGVPLAERRVDLMLRLQELVRETRDTNTAFLTQKLREHVGTDLCRLLADRNNHLPLMLLNTEVEVELRNSLQIAENRHTFKLAPERALALTAAIRGHFENVLRTQNAVPVLVCDDSVRLPLFRLIQHFDPRIAVLSFSELSLDVRPTLTVVGSGLTLQTTD